MSRKKIAFDFLKEKNSKDMIAKACMQSDFVDKKLLGLLKLKYSKKISSLGKVMIYENIISYKLCYFIRARQNEINFLMRSTKLKVKESNPQDSLREDLTLGTLIKVVDFLLKDNCLMDKLNQFNDVRNKLTHFMHIGFYDVGELFKNSEEACLLARDILLDLEKEDKRIGKKIIKKIKVPEFINAEELVKMENDRRSAKFKNPEDINKNLKIYKKNKK